jgi:hypothetical protein
MSEKKQLMDAQLYPAVMHEIKNGDWKKLFTETAHENTSIKRASIVVFNLINRMPQTILEYAAAAKASGEKWKHMPFQTAPESQDMFLMMEKGAAIRHATDWMMPYLEVLAKLQNRPSSQAGKRSIQRFVELVEAGISNCDFRPALECLQAVQSVYLIETKTFAIGSTTDHIQLEQNLERTNRDLLRQIQKLQDKVTPVTTAGSGGKCWSSSSDYVSGIQQDV